MFRFFLSSLKARWFESLLGALIVGIAVTTVLAQKSISQQAEREVHELAHKLGKNMLVLPNGTDHSKFYAMQYGSAVMPDSYPTAIRQSPLAKHISSIEARLYGNITIRGVPLILVGDQDTKRASLTSAGALDDAVLGHEAARRLGVGPGDSLSIAGRRLTIVGVTAFPPDGLDVDIFTSLSTAQTILDRPNSINVMRLGGCWCRLDVPTLATRVDTLLPGSKATTVAGMLKAQKGTIAQVGRYSRVIHWVAIFLVGGMVLLLMAYQVQRHKREIGLLLAVGAKPGRILLLVVGQGILIGVAGALIGYGAGVPLTSYLSLHVLGTPVSAALNMAAPVMGACVLVSAIAAYVPAYRASRLDPTTVLSEV